MEFHNDSNQRGLKVNDCLFEEIHNKMMDTTQVSNSLPDSAPGNCTNGYINNRDQSSGQHFNNVTSFNFVDSYSIHQSVSMKYSQSSIPYIPTTENAINDINDSSVYTDRFMSKQESWDPPEGIVSPNTPDTKDDNFVSKSIQLYFNNSPYNSPKTGSDQSSVHSPSECIISPCGAPLVTCADRSPSQGSQTFSDKLNLSPSPSPVNIFVEKRGKRGRPRGSKNRSTIAKALDPTVFPAGALFHGKKRGRGSRIRGANPGIRARVNYRASADDYSSTMESSAHHDHSNKRGSSTRGRGAMRMCKICVNCLRTDDCAECVFCKDKSKFGGSNKLKQKCLKKQCVYKGKFVEHDNPAEATSRYIVQKKWTPPPLSHPPLSESYPGGGGVSLIPHSPEILEKATYPSAFHSSICSNPPLPFPEDHHQPFISNKDYMLECHRAASLTPLNHDPQVMRYPSLPAHSSGLHSPNQVSPSFPFSCHSDPFSSRPEFLQDIPVKVWMPADAGKCQD